MYRPDGTTVVPTEDTLLLAEEVDAWRTWAEALERAGRWEE